MFLGALEDTVHVEISEGHTVAFVTKRVMTSAWCTHWCTNDSLRKAVQRAAVDATVGGDSGVNSNRQLQENATLQENIRPSSSWRLGFHSGPKKGMSGELCTLYFAPTPGFSVILE